MFDKRFDAANQAQTSEITLELLGAIQDEELVSQRSLAARLGVAVGLTNALVKRCVRKGLLKVQTVPSKRYAYFLTPKGFVEKSRLTAEYLSTSLYFFRDARRQCDAFFDKCESSGIRKIALIGASDLAEIAVLSAIDRGIEIIGIVDGKSNYERLAGVPVVRSLEDAGSFDQVMVTDLSDPQGTYDECRKELEDEKILVLSLLRVSSGTRFHGGRLA